MGARRRASRRDQAGCAAVDDVHLGIMHVRSPAPLLHD
jgi:hypothetical protein